MMKLLLLFILLTVSDLLYAPPPLLMAEKQYKARGIVVGYGNINGSGTYNPGDYIGVKPLQAIVLPTALSGTSANHFFCSVTGSNCATPTVTGASGSSGAVRIYASQGTLYCVHADNYNCINNQVPFINGTSMFYIRAYPSSCGGMIPSVTGSVDVPIDAEFTPSTNLDAGGYTGTVTITVWVGTSC
ncbi:MAG: hypothetical protein WCQ47_03370 [bacterium]